VTLQADNWIRTLDLTTGEAEDLMHLKGDFDPSVLALTPDATQVAVLRQGKKEPGTETTPNFIEIFNLSDGVRKISIESQTHFKPTLKFSPNGKLLMRIVPHSSQPASGLTMYDAETGGQLW
jgi:hypothetical protein